MAVARVPAPRMVLLIRFHHRSGVILGELAGRAGGLGVRPGFGQGGCRFAWSSQGPKASQPGVDHSARANAAQSQPWVSAASSAGRSMIMAISRDVPPTKTRGYARARDTRRSAELFVLPRCPVVVSHGDLHVRHLLVDQDGSATAVIDWGDICLADQAVDLSIAYFGFAAEARADLLSAYGNPVSAERELAARACAISLAASLAEYAAVDGRAALLQECVTGLSRAMAA